MSNDVEPQAVFPDIIVHKRGNNDDNLLIIEMKKDSSREDNKRDLEKLRAFKRELNYCFAFHLILGIQAKILKSELKINNRQPRIISEETGRLGDEIYERYPISG